MEEKKKSKFVIGSVIGWAGLNGLILALSLKGIKTPIQKQIINMKRQTFIFQKITEIRKSEIIKEKISFLNLPQKNPILLKLGWGENRMMQYGRYIGHFKGEQKFGFMYEGTKPGMETLVRSLAPNAYITRADNIEFLQMTLPYTNRCNRIISFVRIARLIQKEAGKSSAMFLEMDENTSHAKFVKVQIPDTNFAKIINGEMDPIPDFLGDDTEAFNQETKII